MKEILLPALRSHVPQIPAGINKPTWHLPAHIYTKDGVDLDFGPLLLFERALIDEYTLEYLVSSPKKYLKPLAESLVVLRDEGFIETRNFASKLTESRSIIDKHVEAIIEDPISLREPVLRGIDGYRSHLPVLEKVFNEDYDPSIMDLGFGTHLYLMKHCGKIDQKERERLDKLMVSSKKRWSEQDTSDVKELIRPTISYLYQNMALSEVYGVPFLDVDYTSELYRLLYQNSLRAFTPEVNQTLAETQNAHHLFKFVIPNLRPATPKKMLALLKDKSIKDFREFISCSARDGKLISPHDYIALTTEIIKKQNELESLREVYGWTERVFSLIPGTSVLFSALGILADKITRHKKTGTYEWLYALVSSAQSKKK